MKITKLKLTAFILLLVLFGCNKEAIKQTALQTAANSNQLVAENNLVAWYTFDSNALDHSGNNNNPSFINATPDTGRFGIPNTAYRFNGSSQYMAVPNSASLSSGIGITLVAVVKPLGFYQGQCHGNRILNKGNNDYINGTYYLGFDDQGYYNGTGCNKKVLPNKQTFYGVSGDYSQNKQAARDTDFIKKQWYVLVYTAGKDSAKLYINGLLKSATSNPNATYKSNMFNLFIARNEDVSFPYWFNGKIDEIRIYNKALSNNEAQLVSKNLGAQ